MKKISQRVSLIFNKLPQQDVKPLSVDFGTPEVLTRYSKCCDAQLIPLEVETGHRLYQCSLCGIIYDYKSSVANQFPDDPLYYQAPHFVTALNKKQLSKRAFDPIQTIKEMPEKAKEKVKEVWETEKKVPGIIKQKVKEKAKNVIKSLPGVAMDAALWGLIGGPWMAGIGGEKGLKERMKEKEVQKKQEAKTIEEEAKQAGFSKEQIQKVKDRAKFTGRTFKEEIRIEKERSAPYVKSPSGKFMGREKDYQSQGWGI